MWDYFSCQVYLLTKDSKDFSGAESYLAKCLAEQSAEWLPINRALRLSGRGLALLPGVTSRVEDMGQRVASVEQQLEGVNHKLDLLLDAVLKQGDKSESKGGRGGQQEGILGDAPADVPVVIDI